MDGWVYKYCASTLQPEHRERGPGHGDAMQPKGVSGKQTKGNAVFTVQRRHGPAVHILYDPAQPAEQNTSSDSCLLLCAKRGLRVVQAMHACMQSI